MRQKKRSVKLLLMKYMLFRTLAPETKQFSRCFLDSVRISAYARALNQIIGRSPASHVLDVGEGWGILAMVAASVGASSATRIEALRPKRRQVWHISRVSPHTLPVPLRQVSQQRLCGLG